MKQFLKPRAYKQSQPIARWVMACLLKNEPASYASVAGLNQGAGGAGANASLKRAPGSQGVDAKPSDLAMGRLKVR